MTRLRRSRVFVMAVLLTVMLVSGRVAAETQSSDDPQAGFGFLIAMGAIVIAMLIARHKRQQYI